MTAADLVFAAGPILLLDLGQRLEALVQSKRAAARRVTLAKMDARPLPVKLRDGFARLFAPYL